MFAVFDCLFVCVLSLLLPSSCLPALAGGAGRAALTGEAGGAAPAGGAQVGRRRVPEEDVCLVLSEVTQSSFKSYNSKGF